MIYVTYFSAAGVPQAGLSPVIITYKQVANGEDVLPVPEISAIGGGGYQFSAVPAEAIYVEIDGGAELAAADRYKVLQIMPQDAYLDAPVSSRSTATQGATKGELDAAQAAIQDDIADLPAPVQIFEGLQVQVAADLLTVIIDGAAGILTFYQGESSLVALLVRDNTGKALDISGASLSLAAKKSLKDEVVAISKDDDDFDKSQAAQGLLGFYMTQVDTANEAGVYLAALSMTWAGEPPIIRKVPLSLELKRVP
jgi:hypothetical protein